MAGGLDEDANAHLDRDPHMTLGSDKIASYMIFVLCILDHTCPMHICQHTHSYEAWKGVHIRVSQTLEFIEEKSKRSLS